MKVITRSGREGKSASDKPNPVQSAGVPSHVSNTFNQIIQTIQTTRKKNCAHSPQSIKQKQTRNSIGLSSFNFNTVCSERSTPYDTVTNSRLLPITITITTAKVRRFRIQMYTISIQNRYPKGHI